MPREAWVVAGPASALARLEPLIEAHRRRRPVRVLTNTDEIESAIDNAAAALVLGGRRPTPGGVFLRARDGAPVPAGALPDAGARLSAYAEAAAAALEREGRGPAVVLGEFDARALALADRVTEAFSPLAPTFNWTAQRLTRVRLSEALGCGPGIALYVGHALAGGWVGYGGFGREALKRVRGKPIGALLSISCSAASRPRRGLSFCEEAALGGLCIAALGARGRTLHADNAELALALADALRKPGVTTLADWLLATSAPPGALDRYRIAGDPLAPLAGALGSEAAARAVFAPGPDDVLPVVPLGLSPADTEVVFSDGDPLPSLDALWRAHMTRRAAGT